MNEGGIATPLILRWPKGIPIQNKLRHDPCHVVDLLPTLVDAAGGGKVEGRHIGHRGHHHPGPGPAGRSLIPAFARDGSVTREFLYFNHNHNRAIRSGDWKLVAIGDNGPWELYDLGKDRSEQKNVAAANPTLASKLASKWNAVDEEFARIREAAVPSTKQLMRGAGA